MVKDPLDNGRTRELPFEPLTEAVKQSIPEIQPGAEVTINGDVYKAEGPEFKSTLTPGEIEAAEKEIRNRSFSGRHPELGKMFKCQVHGFRHREFEFGLKCEQKFTSRIGDYELLREETNEEGEVKLVPAYRTAVQPDSQPTKRQILGAAFFAKKRLTPRYSTLARLLVHRTREIFEARGFSLEAETKEEGEEFKKNLRNAKNIAVRELGKKFEIGRREFKRRGLV